MTERLRYALSAMIVMAFAFASLPGRADEGAVLEMLNQPGVQAIMRHARAPGTGDPATFLLNDCATQRNLDALGRGQARAIGRALKGASIDFDRVLTSQWCRCRETAILLGLGTPEDFPALNSFFQDRSTADDQTQEIRTLLNSLSESEKVLLVTHQVNIASLTGRGAASGEVLLIRRTEAGPVEVVGEFLIRP